ncbi:MAG: phage holin family protein [Candidatus Binatia bacterium]|nr:phage holin family protein [Candidatus Binatia bacterium]
MENGSQHLSAPSFLSLLGGIANDATELLLREVALTKLELQYELRKAKTAAIALGIGIGTIATGGILLTLMLVHVLAVSTVVPLWGCYGIVGSALVVLGGVLLAAGKTKAKELDVVPQPTVERIKESAQWLTKQTTSDKR